MNTIKFESWDGAYPLHKGTDRERHAKTVSLSEGKDIWHRPFEVNSLGEFEDWKQAHGWGGQHVTSLMPGMDPTEAIKELHSNKKTPVEGGGIYFEYMTFYDSAGEFHKCIVFCCNVYIMNAEGQTVDSFAA